MQLNLPQALSQIPCGLFLLTAAYDGARSAVLVEWVQQCATSPPLIMAAVATGLPVVPLIRDSHSFALCQISEDDRFLARKFLNTPDHGDDPFDCLPTVAAPSGAPIVRRALAWLDCEVVRHIDLESDCGLYVGLVRAGGILNDGRPAIRLKSSIYSHIACPFRPSPDGLPWEGPDVDSTRCNASHAAPWMASAGPVSCPPRDLPGSDGSGDRVGESGC